MDPWTIFNYNFLEDPFGILTNLDNEKKDLSQLDEASPKLTILNLKSKGSYNLDWDFKISFDIIYTSER